MRIRWWLGGETGGNYGPLMTAEIMATNSRRKSDIRKPLLHRRPPATITLHSLQLILNHDCDLLVTLAERELCGGQLGVGVRR